MAYTVHQELKGLLGMGIGLVILGLPVNQIAALRATPALTSDVTRVARADQHCAEMLASMQDDELKQQRESFKARIVRSMPSGEREAFEAWLAHEDQLFIQRFGSPQHRKEVDAHILKSLPPEERELFEAQRRKQRDIQASLLDRYIPEFEQDVAESRARIAGIGVLEEPLDLGKSYTDLHYAFTGHSVFTTDPSDAPGDALMTGEPLGRALTYGPARLHDVAATQEFARFLNGLDLGRLQARIERAGIEEWGNGLDGRTLAESAGKAFGALFLRFRGYVTRMAGQQYGLLIWLT